MTRSACLIFNPVAGQSDPEQDLATIQSILQPEINLDIRQTTPEVDADQLAREAVEQGAETIIASGGDGTLSAAAEAVVGTGIPFGVISRGTANAFATALGIPTTIEAACETILGGKTRIIDAAYCNGKPMVLLAGIGFEAETVEQANREAKNRFGMLAYVLAGVQQLRNLRCFETQIETDDKVITLQAAAVTIANAAPPTSVLAQGPAELVVDDGLLDVTLVAPANTPAAIAAAYKLLQSAFSGTASERPDTGYLRTRRIKVTTNPPQKVVLDGELIGNTPVEVECLPGGLTILVPTVPEVNPTEKLEDLPDVQIELKEPEAGSEFQKPHQYATNRIRRSAMPRLIGRRQTNTGSYVTVAFLLGLALGAGVILEYLGVINLIPTFGQERGYIDKQSSMTGKLLAAHNIGN